ncbi:MAG: ArsR/SmtB family transcription factor [Thiohalorhabdus sp.]|uniref:ArsR/SmtB family transcription factor n=1 Tax=Thiohalorhabdus sp. TaxID=3094134 RepID=UPI00397FC29F
MSNKEYSPEQLAAAFKALGNPHRLAVFQRLASCCAPGTACATPEAYRACVGDLGEGLGIAPSTLSHHLKELNRVGLVRMARKGKRTECWVDPTILADLAAFFADPSLLQTEAEEEDE